MALDRRGFAKSLSGVLGAVVAGGPTRASAQAPTACRSARDGTPRSHQGDAHPVVLPSELRPQRAAGVPAKQHGRARRHRRRHHRHRPGRLARHRSQRRTQCDWPERVRHRDDLAGRVHGRLLLARQGAAARARCDRSRPVGHQSQSARCAVVPAVRRQGARTHRAVCDVRVTAGHRAAGGSRGADAERAGGPHDGGRLSRVPRRQRHPAESGRSRRRTPRSSAGRAPSIRDRTSG